MTGITAYWRIDTPTKPSATLITSHFNESGRVRNATIAAHEREHLERERRARRS